MERKGIERGAGRKEIEMSNSELYSLLLVFSSYSPSSYAHGGRARSIGCWRGGDRAGRNP